MLNDPLAAALSKIENAEKIGRSQVVVNPSSKILLKILEIMNEFGYIGSYEVLSEERGGTIKINLIGAINKCNVIKPRFSVTRVTAEKFEKRFLPAQGFGIIIISTSQGLMTLDEAKEKGVGGKLIAFIY